MKLTLEQLTNNNATYTLYCDSEAEVLDFKNLLRKHNFPDEAYIPSLCNTNNDF